jgi:DNA-directed RNA polymerase III subunit RPC8
MRLYQELFPSERLSDVVAEFRMTVFRPFVGEVLTGRIMAATYTGIRISLEFFDDIFIPAHLIFSIASLYVFPSEI